MQATLTGKLGQMTISILLAYAAVCAWLYFAQRTLIYFPVPAVSSPTFDLAVNGAMLKVSVRERESPRALIYFGGNAEDVALNLPDYAQAFPGHALYFLHYRGYGGSSGEPSESALHADALVLFQRVRARHPQVTLVGRSLGSGVAVRLAAQQDVERLLLITPYDSIVNVARHHYPWLPVSWLLKDRYESVRYAPQVRAPTRILMAEHDRVVPRPLTEALQAAFSQGRSTLHMLPGTDHISIAAAAGYFSLLRSD